MKNISLSLKRAQTWLKVIFIDHPSSIGETFWKHFQYASFLSFKLFFLGIILLIHGIFPILFKDFASTRLKKIVERINERSTISSKMILKNKKNTKVDI